MNKLRFISVRCDFQVDNANLSTTGTSKVTIFIGGSQDFT